MRRALTRILSGSAIGQGALLLAAPLLTRLYTTDEFAVLVIVTSIAVVVGGLATLSLDRAITLPSENVKAFALLRASALTSVVVTVIFLAVGWFTRDLMADLFAMPAFANLWWLPAITSLFVASRTLSGAWLVRERQHRRLGRRNAIQGLGQVAWSIGAGLAGLGALGIGASLAVGRLAGTVGALPHRSQRLSMTWVSMRAALYEYRSFPLVNTWSKLANQIGAQAPTLLFAALYGPVAAGLYALTVRMISAPAGVFIEAAAQFFEGEFAVRLREGRSDLVALIQSTSWRLGALTLLPASVVVFLGPPLFAFVFGPEWRGAGVYAQVMALMTVAQMAVTPISSALVLMGYQRAQLVWDVTRGVLTSAAIVLPHTLGLSSEVAIFALTFVMIAWYAIAYWLCVHGARRRSASGS